MCLRNRSEKNLRSIGCGGVGKEGIKEFAGSDRYMGNNVRQGIKNLEKW